MVTDLYEPPTLESHESYPPSSNIWEMAAVFGISLVFIAFAAGLVLALFDHQLAMSSYVRFLLNCCRFVGALLIVVGVFGMFVQSESNVRNHSVVGLNRVTSNGRKSSEMK